MMLLSNGKYMQRVFETVCEYFSDAYGIGSERETGEQKKNWRATSFVEWWLWLVSEKRYGGL